MIHDDAFAPRATYSVACPCGCGEAVALRYAGGFASTEAELEACSARRADGVRSYNVRKSAAMGFVRLA